jgi:hypothetical protein
MQFKALLLSACAMFSTGAWAQKSPVECLPQEQGALELKAIRPGFFTVDGRMGQFDPCESLVKYRVPTQKGPEIISARSAPTPADGSVERIVMG